MSTKSPARIAVTAGWCLVAAACGGGSDTPPAAESEGPTTIEQASTATTDAAPATDPPATDPPATDPPATDPPATDPPPTTEPPAPEPTSFDLAMLPDLIDSATSATTDPTIDPLSIAQRLIGFPYAIPMPAGARLYELSVDPWFSDESISYAFSYATIAPGGVVPDIDIALDDNGPGSVEVIETWDPIMATLGFERKNSTASDPGDPGGPNSVNHVYTTATPEGVFNGVPGEVAPVFVWSSEDINGWSYSSEREQLAGYSIDVEIDVAPGAGVPIPLVNALLELLELPDGLELSDASVDLRSRPIDSYDADKGPIYVDVYIEWEAPAELFDTILAFYADPAAVFTDEPMLMAGEEDFFNPGMFERTEWYAYGESDQRLGMLLLQRYEATLGIDASADGAEPARLFLDLEINPVAPPLEPPTG